MVTNRLRDEGFMLRKKCGSRSVGVAGLCGNPQTAKFIGLPPSPAPFGGGCGQVAKAGGKLHP